MSKKVVSVLLTAAMALTFVGCGKQDINAGKYELPHHRQTVSEVDDSLYYSNDLETATCDPSVLWVSEEQSKEYGGYFYLYSSAESELFYRGVPVYRSRNMSDWEYLGPAFYPEKASYWATLGMMAPETIYDAATDKYYMYFSGAEDRKLYFNSQEDKAEYYSIQEQIETTYTDFSAALGELEEYRKLIADENEPEVVAEEGDSYTPEELDAIEEIFAEYDAAIGQSDTDAKKLEAAKSALLKILSVKIDKREYTSNRYGLGVAVSDNPVGPFVQYTNDPEDADYDETKRTVRISDPFICHEDFAGGGADLGGTLGEGGKLMIGMDVSPFEDPKTHDKYIYFSNPYMRQEYMYALKIGKDWTDDPEWSTLTAVTRHGYTTVNGNEMTDYTMSQTRLDEAPHAYYDAESDNYYLAFTFDGAWNKTYAVGQAVSKSPMGPFTKIKQADGGVIVSANQMWDHVSGTGHCCFVKYGEKLYIGYQGIYNRLAQTGGTYSSKRGVCVDEIKFITNGKGQKIMYANGPSVAPMPLIGPDAQYENIAGDAVVTVSGGENRETLNDGLITYTLYHELVKEFEAKKGTTEITLSFEDYRTIRSIMIFNSKNIDTMFDKIDRIELDFKKTDINGNEVIGTAYMENLLFDTDAYLTNWGGDDSGIDIMMRPGGSVTAEFDELQVKTIRITLKSDKPVSISEIFLLGK